MKQVDLLIVGGGPAGSSLAYALAKSELEILIMDKENFPRQKTCAGWVTPVVMEMLHIDLSDYAKGRILQKIHGFKIASLGERPVRSDYHNDVVSYGIRRIEFDDYLLQRCGAELLPAQPFKKMRKTDNGWIINDCIEAKMVIGAGGHFCPVARAVDSKGISELAVAAQEVEFEMTEKQRQECPVDATIPELFFTPDLMGYGWIFRKGNYLNIGLGREDKSRLSSHVSAFCDYLQQTNRVPFDIVKKFNGHAYLLYPHAVRKMVADHVLLIGDSAGLAGAQSGEGIRPAVESAIIAAGVIRHANGDYTQENLQYYNTLMQQYFGQRQPPADFIERLPTTIKQFFARHLMRTKWFTRKIVIEQWFLQTHQQPLLLSGEPLIKS